MIPREIERNTFHEAVENHRETFTEKKRQGGVLPDLPLARLSGGSLHGQRQKALAQVTLQKCSTWLHKHHNAAPICCAGMQPSHLKRDGDAAMSRKDFLSFCELEAFAEWVKCAFRIVP